MYEYNATVVRVVDGDTVDIDVDLGLRVHTEARCRLLGLNAPEKRTEEGRQSAAFLAGLLPAGAAVRIRTQKDRTEKYGRWLAQVFLGEADVGAQMVERGLATVWDGTGQRP